MFRPEHKFLQIFIFIALFSISSSAYGYFDSDNIPDGAPANYQPIDSAYFAGGPAFAEYSPMELGGYYVFRDDQTGVWTLAGLIWPGGSFYEQIHGSVLVQMDRPPEAGVNVWPLGYEVSDNLMKNDRWGWVKYPDSIAPNLYEIWWDYTIDYARLENLGDPYDSIGISFLGCAFDFNIWATGHFGAFSAEQIKIGRDMIPLTDIPGFVDSYSGIEDQYQGTDNSWEANSSAFTSKDLPGATYNKNGPIEPGDDYGDAFGGSRAYEGNGYQFSVLACPGDDENHPPEFNPPLGQTTTLSLCSDETISETIIAVDPDIGDIISLSIISGPGTLISTPSASPVIGYFTWMPTESGHFTVVYRAVDSHGLSVTDSLVYDITINQAPEITCPQNQIEFLCAPEKHCYQIEAFDNDDDNLTYELISGPGEIDPATGLLCFTAEEEGTYTFAVAVADQCDTVSCVFDVTIYMNQPPEVTLSDSIHFFCDPGKICLPLTTFDAGGNIVTIAVDAPAYLSTDRQSVCMDIEQAGTYNITVSVIDDCGATTTVTAVVTAVFNSAPTLYAPLNTEIFDCQPGEICVGGFDIFDIDENLVKIEFDPPGEYSNGNFCFTADTVGRYSFMVRAVDECGMVSQQEFFVDFDLGNGVSINCPIGVQPISLCGPDSVYWGVSTLPQNSYMRVIEGEAVYADGLLSFYAAEAGLHEFTLVADSDCGSDTCTVTFDVSLNEIPQATAPNDQELFVCDLSPITISGFACFDNDDNLVSCDVDNGEMVDGSMTFTPVEGINVITLTATDDCGKTSTSQTTVTVSLNSPPVATCPGDIEYVFGCEPQEICFGSGFTSFDPDNNIFSETVSLGVLSGGAVCFMPDTAGVYEIIYTVTDECGATDECISYVTVRFENSPPVCNLPDDMTYTVCGDTTFSFDVSGYDVDDNLVECSKISGPGTLENGVWTFTTSGPGTYTASFECVDECGLTCSGEVTITVEGGDSPVITCPPSDVIHLCSPEMVSVPLSFTPIDAELIITPQADYSNGMLTFFADTAGTYCFTAEATTDCGTDVCHFCITVTFDSPPMISIPDTTVALCTIEEICLPMTFSDPDDNIASIGVGTREFYLDGNGSICFSPDQAGIYEVVVNIIDSCGNSDVDTAHIDVSFGEAPQLSCPPNQDIHLCGPDSISIPISVIPAGTALTITPEAVYSDGKLTFYAGIPGSYDFTVEATTDCGTDVCSFSIDVSFDSAPVVIAPPDKDVFLCQPGEICIDQFDIYDVDNNITALEIIPAIGTFSDGTFCFTPDTVGRYCFVIRVTDACGNVSEDEFCVNYGLGDTVAFDCPDSPQVIGLCQPDSICLDIGVIPADAQVTVIDGNGVYADGALCFYAGESGIYNFTIVAQSDCGSDTCQVTFDVTLDQAPQITCPPSQDFYLCGPDYVSIPVGIIPPQALLSISPAADYANGLLTFMADTAGTYCFTIDASTDCGTDQCQFCVNVIFNSAPVVSMNDTTLFQCDTEEICLPVFISDDDSVLTVTVYPEAYSIDNGSICFTPDGPGLFEFIVTVSDDCNFTTVDTARVEVFRNQPPEVTVGDTSLFVCEPTEICLPVDYSDADNNIDSITVSAPAVYDEQNETVCLTVSESGDYEVIVTVYDECNVIAADTSLISVTVNSDPTVTAPSDTSVFYCRPSEICLDGFDIFDADGNITNIEFIPALGSYSNGSYCFTPDTAGVYCLIVRVTDDCGGMAEDTVCVTYGLGENVAIECPGGIQPVALCQPDSVCLDIPIAPLDAAVTVIDGDAVYADGRLCFYAETSGTYTFTLVAANDCGADTCLVEFEVTLGQAPQLSCLPSEQIHLCSPDSISVPLGVIPAEAALTITPEAVYADGQLTFMADTAGQYCFNIKAETECGIDQCQFCITVTIDSPPEITVPDSLVALCELSEICLPITFSDPNDNIASIAVESQRFEYANGQICFIPDGPGTYDIIVTVTDSCGLSAVDTGTVVVTIGESPLITCPPSESIHLCGPEYISIPLEILPATADLTFTPGDVVYENGLLTFMADTAGVYCFNIKAATECGTDACDFCITVTFDAPPQVSIPDTLIALCASEEVCVPVSYFDPDGNLADVVLVTPGYEIINDSICFIPDGAGIFQFIVAVTDSCGNAAADTGDVEIVINDGPVVDVGDTTIFICGSTEICLPIEFSDPDGYIDSIVVSAPAVYDSIEQAICVTITQEGEYQITVTVYDDCGISAADIGTIKVTLNDKPMLTIGEYQTQQSLCALEELCIPATAFDLNGNMASITGTGSCGTEFIYTQYEHTLCWMPLDFGLCSVTVIATDLCGLSDTSIAVIELIELPVPEVRCPDDTTLFLCDTGIACLDVGVLGQNPQVFGDDIFFNPALNRICFNVQGDRIDTILVVDSAECGVDSCSFVITSILNGPPMIAAESTIEQRFCEPFTFCFTAKISDPDDNIESIVIAGDCGGYYDAVNNRVCIDVVEDIDCNLEIIVTDSCGKSSSVIAPIKATRNLAPRITLPNLETVVRCETDTATIFIANICVTDPDYGEVVLTLDSGLGEFVFDPITYCGTLSFAPPVNDSAEYCFRFAAADGCDTTYETYCIMILPTPVCETCVDVSIVGPGCVNIGSVPTVSIIAKAESEIAAFDLLVHYDASVLTFTMAYIGQAISEWEYFTYRFGAVGNCDGSCPSGLIRLVGIADINDGPNHPPENQLMPDGAIANMVFQVANNANLGGHNIPIGFFWYDCGDNSLSDPTGQYQLIDQAVFGPEGNIIWDEFNEAGYPEDARLPNVGAPDDCIVGDRDLPVRCVDFHNGDLCIIHPDSIDDRGDLNLNGIAYEIADAVVYTSYFIHGLAAFTISIPAQIVASDVNADGLTLSIADLVYLIRVVTGDANPYAKPIVGDNLVAVTSVPAGDNYRVSVDSENDIGATLLTFAYDGVLPGEPRLAEDVADMEMIYNFTADGTLRVLIYSFEPGRKIPAGRRDLVEIPGAAEAELSLIDIDMADYYGRTLKTDLTEVVLPDRLELSQNQPNPFNPSTTFNLALPQASDYDVTIYNITGQTVRRWTGHAGPGLITFEWDGTNTQGQRVATGVYLYRARAMGSEAIRKMILLK